MTKILKVIPGEEWLNSRYVQDVVKSEFIDEVVNRVEDLPIFSDSKSYALRWEESDLPSDLSAFSVLIWFNKSHDQNVAECIPSFDKSNKKDYLKFIIGEGRRYNIDMSEFAAALFVSVGNCAHKLSIEVEKLHWVSDPSKPLSSSDFKSIICFSATESPKKIVEAICEGRITKAIAWYDHLQKEEAETGWILAYLEKFFEQCTKLKRAELNQDDLTQTLSSLELHRYRYENEHKILVHRLSLDKLQRGYDLFKELYGHHKTGRLHSHQYISIALIELLEEHEHVSS